MPAGVLRVYQQDSKGGTSSSAKTESCTRRRTATNFYNIDYEITLRNHKSTAIQVEVNETGRWC